MTPPVPPAPLTTQVNYKADLNWSRGVGWTPPGCHKAELARRAAELGLAEGVTTDEAIAQYQQLMMVSGELTGFSRNSPASPGFGESNANANANTFWIPGPSTPSSNVELFVDSRKHLDIRDLTVCSTTQKTLKTQKKRLTIIFLYLIGRVYQNLVVVFYCNFKHR